MKRKLEECAHAAGIACRDWLGASFPQTFPNFMEVYIAIQDTYAPPTIPGVHTLYLIHEPLDVDSIRQYVNNRQSTQLVVRSPNDAIKILQTFAPTFNVKSLNLDHIV